MSMELGEIKAENLLSIIEEKDRQIAQRDKRIAELEEQMQLIISHLKLSKHKQFAPSSEKSQVLENQISFFNEAESLADLSVAEPEITEVKSHYRKRTRLTTDKLPQDLPVEVIEYEIPEQERICSDCQGPLHRMGKDEREELKIIPAKAVLVRHIQHVYSCRCCENNSECVNIVKAQMPEPVIKKSFASAETIAHIAIQKYVMASPLYRQEAEWKQKGILLSRQSMSNWLIKASDDWLLPIYEKMKEDLVKQRILHADETPLKVLKEANKSSKSKKYMWLYRTSGNTDKQIVIYDYQPDRKYENPKTFLKDFKGYLHADGFEGYHKLPEDIVIVGCMAHLRRYFVDALKTLPKDMRKTSKAQIGVNYCDNLFKLEREFAKYDSKTRYEKRLELSKPILEEFYAWLDTLEGINRNLLGRAKDYAINQRSYVERYLMDGDLEISNNRAERSIKPFVIGRKNWLFNNTSNGAKASAIYYSLIISAVENNLNPYEYLSWILKNSPNLGKPGYPESINSLVPHSDDLPESIFVPSNQSNQEVNAWEEDN